MRKPYVWSFAAACDLCNGMHGESAGDGECTAVPTAPVETSAPVRGVGTRLELTLLCARRCECVLVRRGGPYIKTRL
jgi:hypothetical protein